MTPPAATSHARPPTVADELLDALLAEARPGGTWFEEGLPRGAPACSVVYGAAGLAAAIYHVAVLRADPELLALADEWIVRALRESDGPAAFSSDELGLDERVTGRVSPFHRLSGVHAVQVLVSHAMDDIGSRQQALDAFVTEARRPCDGLDLTLGRSGILLAGALMLEAVASPRYLELRALRELGDATLAGLWAELDAMPPIADALAVSYLGMAHGWAGVLLASLRWCRAAHVAVPGNLTGRLDQLAGLAESTGRGVRWPIRTGTHGPTPMTAGWCHGTAGFVHLWATAHEALGDDRWATLAEQAAWTTSSDPNGIAQLCCGQAGQAHALLALYRSTGEIRWLRTAGELATLAAQGASRLFGPPVAASLHKGITGVAVLAADLAEPELAAMPFFGKQA